MGVYEDLGVRAIVNAAGPLTRLGGMPLHPEVAAALAEASRACARIEDLQEAAGRYLAEVTGAESGYVTAGAAAGLALAAAACIAGLDVASMDRLPDTTGMRDEIIVQRAHLTAYTHALRLPGAKLVEVGYLGYPGQGITWPWQIEAAISERTAAIAWAVGDAGGIVALDEVVRIAHRHGLPVIVDAAAALPPVENLRALVAAGADLVAFSGGKAVGGPQASGILVGRAELIESVALQHQDMDVLPQTWTWRERYLASGRLPGPPHHGIGRPMKVGREEIVGLCVALRRFVALDHAAERRRQEQLLAEIRDGLADLPGVTALIRARPQGWPTLVVTLDGPDPADVINALLDDDPPVALSQSFIDERAVGVVASTLTEGQHAVVLARLREALRR
jgi:L-seryl-tRNA(Ser) seleniumtransferase